MDVHTHAVSVITLAGYNEVPQKDEGREDRIH
jgi:hypothetical protein